MPTETPAVPPPSFGLLGGTPVHTPLGDVPVDLLQPGQPVCASHTLDHTQVLARTLSDQVCEVTRQTYDGPLVTLDLHGGASLRLTPEHPLWTQRGWVPAAELDEHDLLWIWRPDRPAPRELERVSTARYTGHLYTLHTSLYGTAFAGQVLLRARRPGQGQPPPDSDLARAR